MANHGLMIQTKVMAEDVKSLVRPVTSASDIDNGNVFQFSGKTAEVWTAIAPATGAGLTHLWMAAEPEVVITYSGSSAYKGLDPNALNFYNKAGVTFTAIQPQLGDLIELNAEALGGTKSSNAYVVATNGDFKLNWGASAVSGLSLHLVETKYISLATGAIDSQRITSYLFEVVAVA